MHSFQKKKTFVLFHFKGKMYKGLGRKGETDKFLLHFKSFTLRRYEQI